MTSLEQSMDAQTLWIAIGLGALVLVVYAVVTYNRLVQLRLLCNESFADIDTELVRRHELIPNLLNVVKGYAQHEQELLEKLTQARSRAISALSEVEKLGGNAQRGRRAQASWVDEEAKLARLVGQVVVKAEAYPELKADKSFLKLMQELSTTEDRIQAARRFFNANVREFNALCEQFPSLLIARILGFVKRPFFDVENPLKREAFHISTQPESSSNTPENPA